MKKGKRNSIIITAVFVLGSLISCVLLIQLKSTLALDAGVLGAGEIEKAQPYIAQVQLAVFATFIIGLVGFYLLQRMDRSEVIYVDKRSSTLHQSDTNTQENNKGDKVNTKDLPTVFNEKKRPTSEAMFSAICKEIAAVSGAFYTLTGNGKGKKLELDIPYALSFGESNRPSFEIGEGLVGQSAKEKAPLFVDDVPENAIIAKSGLGQASPTHLAVLPVLHKTKLVGICEIGTFRKIDSDTQEWLVYATNAFADRMAVNGQTEKEKVKAS